MGNTTVDTSVIRIGIIDDHILFTSAIAEMLSKQKDFDVVLQAQSGIQLLQQLRLARELPDILLMDVSMNDMDGIEATRQTTALYPTIKIIALTAQDDEWRIIKMIKAGCCAYLKKDIHTTVLEIALREVYRNGKYHADIYHLNAASILRYEKDKMQEEFTDQEIRFLELTCEGLTHKEISEKLFLSPSSIDYCRSVLFRKLGVDKVTTMVLEALRRGIISLRPDKKL